MTGVEMLARARAQVPDAKLLLLTAYADTDAAITRHQRRQLDYYLLKPWDPPGGAAVPGASRTCSTTGRPDFQPALRGRARHRPPLVGRGHEVKDFLARNHIPYQWLDSREEPERPPGWPKSAGPAASPAAGRWCSTPTAPLARPDPRELAEKLGLRTQRRARRSTTWSSSAAGPPGWRRPSTPRPKGCARS